MFVRFAGPTCGADSAEERRAVGQRLVVVALHDAQRCARPAAARRRQAVLAVHAPQPVDEDAVVLKRVVVTRRGAALERPVRRRRVVFVAFFENFGALSRTLEKMNLNSEEKYYSRGIQVCQICLQK